MVYLYQYCFDSFCIVVGVLVVGFLHYVTKCTTDSSWFVKKAAVDLISKILSSVRSNTSASAGILSDEEEKMIAIVFAPMMLDQMCDVSRLSVCLDILDSRDLLISVFSFLHLDQVQIVERLCVILNCLPVSLCCDSERRVLEILTSVCEAYSCFNEAKLKLLQLVTTLLNDGRILSAVIVAVWMLRRFVTTPH